MSDCLKANYTLFIALRLLEAEEAPSEADLESARQHLLACSECRAAIPEEVCGRFGLAPGGPGAPRRSSDLQRSR